MRVCACDRIARWNIPIVPRQDGYNCVGTSFGVRENVSPRDDSLPKILSYWLLRVFRGLVRNDILLVKGSRVVYATRVRLLENNVRIQTVLGKLIPFRILYYHTYVLESITTTVVLSGGVRSPQETMCIIANSYFRTVFNVAAVCATSVIM